eukprot:scaffold7163_cov79-Isochrysis_galbana.AAC.1
MEHMRLALLTPAHAFVLWFSGEESNVTPRFQPAGVWPRIFLESGPGYILSPAQAISGVWPGLYLESGPGYFWSLARAIS